MPPAEMQSRATAVLVICCLLAATLVAEVRSCQHSCFWIAMLPSARLAGLIPMQPTLPRSAGRDCFQMDSYTSQATAVDPPPGSGPSRCHRSPTDPAACHCSAQTTYSRATSASHWTPTAADVARRALQRCLLLHTLQRDLPYHVRVSCDCTQYVCEWLLLARSLPLRSQEVALHGRVAAGRHRLASV